MGLYLWESVKGANIFSKLAFIFLLIAMFCGWIAFCTSNWVRVYNHNFNNYYVGYGVWRVSENTDTVPTNYSHNDGWLLKWFGAFQAFASFGFICMNVGFFLVVLFLFVKSCKSNADLAFWNGINNIFGSICWLVAIILFAAEYKDFDRFNFKEPSLHYSFGLAIIAFLLQLAAGIVLLLTNRGGGAVQSR